MELQSHLVSTPKCLFLISMPVSCGVVLSQYHVGRSRWWHMPVSSKKKHNTTSQEKSTGSSNIQNYLLGRNFVVQIDSSSL